MAYPFADIPALRTFIINTFTANGNREITGPDTHDALLGILDLIAPALQANLTAKQGAGGSVGGVNDNDFFAAGTTLEAVLRALLIKTVHPTYVLPTEVLSSDILVFDQEIGSIISPSFSMVFTQNDAGALTGISLQKNNVQISNTLPYTDGSVSLDGTAKIYKVISSYAQGACKNNNLAVLDCVGRIIAGNLTSNLITYNSYRKAFFGTPVATPTTSADIRGLSGGVLNPVNGTQFSINILAGSQYVVFAYPASLEDVASVKYRELSNTEVKGNFVQSTISVQGANSFAAVSYKVYVYTPVEPFPSGVTYDVTI